MSTGRNRPYTSRPGTAMNAIPREHTRAHSRITPISWSTFHVTPSLSSPPNPGEIWNIEHEDEKDIGKIVIFVDGVVRRK